MLESAHSTISRWFSGAGRQYFLRRIRVNAAFTPSELQFQDDVRAFLAAEFPGDIRQKLEQRLRLEKDDYVR